MRILFLSFTILFIFLSSKVFSKNVEEGLFILESSSSIKTIIKMNPDLTVDHVTKEGFELYGPRGIKTWLDGLKVKYIPLPKIDKSIALSYPTPEQVEEKLKILADNYAHIISLKTIGKSHKGRPIFSIKISDNPNSDEVEPEFKYIANMHGDEIVGRELMVLLIEDIVKNYDKGTKEIVNLVNNTEIYIIPSMNPDGAQKRRRGNAKHTDLNRSFPDFTTRDNSNTTSGRAPETKAIMDFTKKRNFSLSANFHGGTEVVNYPWDTSAEDFPLESFITQISKKYAYNIPSMRNSSRFKDGVTNGYDWYEVNGGMQDWSYNWHNDLQVTVELSHKKWPNYNEIPGYYKKNKTSLIEYILQIQQGAGFSFNDKSINGQVEVISRFGEKIGNYSFTHGEFYKVLPIGSYEFKITTKTKKIAPIKKLIRVKKNDIQSRPNYLAL